MELEERREQGSGFSIVDSLEFRFDSIGRMRFGDLKDAGVRGNSFKMSSRVLSDQDRSFDREEEGPGYKRN